MKAPVFRSYTVFERVVNDYRTHHGLPAIQIDRSVPLSLVSELYSAEYNHEEYVSVITGNCLSIMKSMEHELDLLTPAKKKKFVTLIERRMGGGKIPQRTWFHDNEFMKLSAVLDMQRVMNWDNLKRCNRGRTEESVKLSMSFALVASTLSQTFSSGSLVYGLLTYLFDCAVFANNIEETEVEAWEAAMKPFFDYSATRQSPGVWWNALTNK